LAFTTIPGANGIDFVGTADNDDILLTLNEAGELTANGLSGNDTMTFVNTTGVVGTVTAVGAEGNDLFVFTQDGANTDDARVYSSEVAGGAGNDSFNIAGGAWTSEIRGGAGNDVFELGTNYTKTNIKGGADGDSFTGGTAGVVTRLNATVLELDNSKIRGQGGNDTAMDFRGFLLSSDDSTINGNGGNDTIRLGFFNNVDGLLIAGGANDDDIIADVDPSAPNGIQFNGGSGIDSIIASTGNDLINGGADSDTIFGRAGNDTIDAGTGADFADGEGGADTIVGGTGNDTVEGGAGNDTINGNDGNDNLSGEAGDDTISGDAGNDAIDGGVGRDSLSGNAGRDTIIDRTGADTIVGGNGGDTITFNNGVTEFGAGAVAGNTDAANALLIAANDAAILAANDDVDDVYVLNAITDSNASSPTAATNAYDVVTGFAVTLDAAGAYASGTQIDFKAIDDILAGAAATSFQLTNANTDVRVPANTVAATYANFAALVADFNTPGAPIMDPSSETTDGLVEAYVFTTNIAAAGVSTYVVINDTAAQLTAGDVMIDFGDQSGDIAGFMADLDASIAKGTGLTIV
jgi:hypothetical protein